MGELEELVLANRRITESVVGDMEARVEELQEKLEQKVLETKRMDVLLKGENETIKELKTDQKAEVEDMTAKLKNKEYKIKAMESFEEAVMKTLINPDVVEALDTMKKQQQKIYDLERKLQETRLKTNKFLETEKEIPRENAIMKLRGINISVVKHGNDHNEREFTEQEKLKGTNIPKSLSDFLKTRNIDVGKSTAKPTDDLEEENKVEMGEDDSDEDYSEEEEDWKEENIEKKDLDETYCYKAEGEKKQPAEAFTLKELDAQEVEEEDFNPFWFCGPPAVLRIDGQKPAKMWRGEEGEDCGDCAKNWVHHCLQDILVK